MQNSKIFGYAITDIKYMYVTEKLSWDEIAAKCNKARSSVIKKVKKVITEQGYAEWQAIRKNGSAGSDLYEGDIQVHNETTSEPAQKKEPLKYIARSEDNGVKYVIFNGSEQFTLLARSLDICKKVLNFIEQGDVSGIQDLCDALGQIKKVSGITYDSVAKTFNLGGIELEEKYQQLIIKGYEELKKGNKDTLNGLVRLIHRLNSGNKLNILDQLYEFLKHNDIEILSNGLIVGYKYLNCINDGFYDDYTKTIKQDVKDYVYTLASKVNPDKNTYCSHGLHCGSWHYVKGNTTIAKVIIDPLDVISIPLDYSGSKMRSKGYYIIEILDNPSITDFKPIDVDTLNLDKFNPVFVENTGGNYEEE